MTLEEAIEWLSGKRSMCNLIPSDAHDGSLWLIRTAQADAALTEQAYWIVRAHKESLLPVELKGGAT